MAHITEVIDKGNKYLYKVDGKLVRTSARKYIVSTADGSFFSSRLDLIQKNSEYQRILSDTIYAANLTEFQYKELQEKRLRYKQKQYNNYSDESSRDEWINKTINILFAFGNKPTPEYIEEYKQEHLQKWDEWLNNTKEDLDKHKSFMNNQEAMTKDFESIRTAAQKRLTELELVTYQFN